MTDASPARYRAFISYRHADRAWGDWLHKALESYRVPKDLVGSAGEIGPVPARLTPIFRDREELGASSDLGDRLRAALSGSANLIVICTPRSAQSKWVNEEILTYKRLGGAHRIFALVADGEPNAADPARECFPPALKYQLGPDGELGTALAEPLAADAREHADGKENAKLKLIAGLIGVPYDRLRRRELEAQRRAFRRFAIVAGSIAVIFAGLAAAATWFGYQATLQRDRAQANLVAATDAAEAQTQRLEDDMLGRKRIPRDEAARMLEGMTTLLDRLAEGQPLTAAAEQSRWKTMLRRADAALTLGDMEGATARAAEALALADRLAAAAPADRALQHNLSLSMIKAGDIAFKRADFAVASAQYGRALRIAEANAAAAPDDLDLKSDLATAYLRGGMALLAKGDLPATPTEFTRAAEIDAVLVATKPDNPAYARALALDNTLLGRALTFLDELDDAQAALGTAAALYGKLADGDPLSTGDRYNAANTQTAIAMVQGRNDDTDEAIASYRQALAVIEPMSIADPVNAELQTTTAQIYSDLGDLLLGENDLPGAQAAYEKDRDLLNHLIALSPTDSLVRSRYGWSHMRIGGVQLKRKDFRATLNSFEAGVAVMEALGRDDGEATAFRRDIAAMKERLAVALDRTGDRTAALAQLKEAQALLAPLLAAAPDNPEFQGVRRTLDVQLSHAEKGEPLQED